MEERCNKVKVRLLMHGEQDTLGPGYTNTGQESLAVSGIDMIKPLSGKGLSLSPSV